jgi:Domain of unknown function (DUF222)
VDSSTRVGCVQPAGSQATNGSWHRTAEESQGGVSALSPFSPVRMYVRLAWSHGSRGDQATPITDPTPVDHALDQLSTSLDHLIKVVEDGGLDGYDKIGLIGFLQLFERFRNRLPLIDHRAIREAESRSLPDALTQPSMIKVLISALRVSPGEAQHRMKSAEAVGEWVSMLGQYLAPVRPVLAAAQRNGNVTPEQVHIIQRVLARVDRPGFNPADIAAGETLLTRFAHSFGPKELSQLAERTVDAIDPDGTLATEQ